MVSKNNKSTVKDNNIVLILILLLIVFVSFNYMFSKKNNNSSIRIDNNLLKLKTDYPENFQNNDVTEATPPAQPTPSAQPTPPAKLELFKKIVSCRGTEIEVESIDHIKGIYYLKHRDIYGDYSNNKIKNYIGVDNGNIILRRQHNNNPIFIWTLVRTNQENKFKISSGNHMFCDNGFSFYVYNNSHGDNHSNCLWTGSTDSMGSSLRYSDQPSSGKFSNLSLEEQTKQQENSVKEMYDIVKKILQDEKKKFT